MDRQPLSVHYFWVIFACPETEFLYLIKERRVYPGLRDGVFFPVFIVFCNTILTKCLLFYINNSNYFIIIKGNRWFKKILETH